MLHALEAEGLCDPSMIHDDVEDIVGYARKYIPKSFHYKHRKPNIYCKIWHKLHTYPDSRIGQTLILLLYELVFSLPLSTCHVEQ
jgi:hypothetical protein